MPLTSRISGKQAVTLIWTNSWTRKSYFKLKKIKMIRRDIKIATLNLCLGLKNKKQIVDQMRKWNKIYIFCLQEVEIESDFKTDLLNIAGFTLELECNTIKARTGVYLSNNISYIRNIVLEGTDSHFVIIVDVVGVRRIILLRNSAM